MEKSSAKMKKTLLVALFFFAVLPSSACSLEFNTSAKATVTPTSTTAPVSSPTLVIATAATPVPKETPKSTRTTAASISTPTVVKTGQTPTAATAPKTPTTAAKATTPTQVAKQTPTVGSSTSGTGDALAFLKSAIANQNRGDYKITYLIKGLSADNKNEEYTWTYYVKGTQSRLDAFQTKGNTTNSTRTYVKSKDEVVSCTEESAKWTCQKYTGDAAGMMVGLTTAVIDSTNQGVAQIIQTGQNPKETKSRTVAGQNVTSYVFNAPPPTDGTVEIAYTNDGILLLLDVRTTDKAIDGKMEATEFSRQVSDSDFIPPA